MVMTVLEAQVAQERVGDLERAYREGASQLPPDIVETFLVRDSRDATVFRIMTVWVSREALEQMRASGVEAKYYEGGGHNGLFSSATQHEDEVQRITAFLKRHLFE